MSADALIGFVNTGSPLLFAVDPPRYANPKRSESARFLQRRTQRALMGLAGARGVVDVQDWRATDVEVFDNSVDLAVMAAIVRWGDRVSAEEGGARVRTNPERVA